MTNQEINEAVARKLPYHLTERGKATAKAYREAHRAEHLAYKRRCREKQANLYPEKIRARSLIGDAVRYGLIPKPAEGEWKNRWEFHHPDHSRPYYGVWLRHTDHHKVEKGKIPCPPCTDYSDTVRKGVLKKWGFND